MNFALISTPIRIFEDTKSHNHIDTDDVYPRGYPELTAFMKSDPETNIFRRFDYLHLRQLLHSQEELSMLEESLHKIDTAELTETNNMSRRYDTNEERKNLMHQIRERLSEYGAVVSLILHMFLNQSWISGANDQYIRPATN